MTAPTRGRKPLSETLAANAAAMRLMAALSPKPVSADGMALTVAPVAKEKKPRAKPGANGRPLETPIKMAVLAAVRRHPKVAWAGIFNRGGTYFGKQFVQFNTVKGLSDIGGQMKDGRALWLEAKRDAKGDISPDQVLFVDMVAAFNGVSGIVWTVEMALAIWTRHDPQRLRGERVMETVITFADGRTVTRPGPETIEQFLEMERKWLAMYPPTPISEQDQRAADARFEVVRKRFREGVNLRDPLRN